MIHRRQLLAQGLEVLAVRVPAAEGQRHAADAGFDQPASGEELLDALVAVADCGLLLRQIEGLADGARSDHVEGPCREGVQPLHGAAGVDVPAGIVEADEQILAIVDTALSDAVGKAQVLQARAVRRERPVGDAQEAGFGADAHAAQADERRDVGGLPTAELRHDRAERRVMGGPVFSSL